MNDINYNAFNALESIIGLEYTTHTLNFLCENLCHLDAHLCRKVEISC